MSETAVLLSGGIDSTALAYMERPRYAITLNYGQRAFSGELRASTIIAEALGIEHIVIEADLSGLGSGDMSDKPELSIAPVSEWWPFRNQLLLTVAAMAAVSREVSRLCIGTVASDNAHADGRPEFIEAINTLTSMQEGALRIEAPVIALSSVELVRMSGVPLALLGYSHSCHTDAIACCWCRGCQKHLAVISHFGKSRDQT